MISLPANNCYRKRLIAVQGLLLAISFHSAAQKIDSALNVLATKFPEEKVYIHYDKEYYVVGETIWFKAYLYSNGLPSGLSNNFYLQLIDIKGNVISSKQYPVNSATVKGNIDLPDSLKQGYYYIKALTPTMLNSYESIIYSKSIFIFNPLSKQQSQPVAVSKNFPIAVQFFPESGNLVAGILTTIAFKAIDSLGRPVNISGVIKMDDGTNITSFRSFHDGIGRTQFRPKEGKKYIAVVDDYAQPNIYPLPAVQPSGINLKVEEEKGGRVFSLTRGESGKNNFNELLLVAQINNSIVYEKTISFENFLSVKGHLLTDSLPAGILHFTVFSSDGIPLAERLTFINNDETENKKSIVVIKKGTGARERNIFEINFSDSLQRSCSVAITDFVPAPFTEKENIRSKLLLTDDLRGHIFNPGYYFEKQNDSVLIALDNVMLTHGWSRFNWSKILSDQFPEKKYTDAYLINISGMVNNQKDNRPVEGGILNVLLSTEDSALYTYDIVVNESGFFLIDSLIIVGKTKIYYTYTDKKGKEKPVLITMNENILLRNVAETLSIVPENQPFAYPVGLKKSDIVSRYEFVNKGNPEAKMLENVVLKTKVKRPVDIVNEKYTSEIFRTGGRVIIDNINNKPASRSMSAFDFVRNRITTVDTQYGTFVNKKNFSLLDNKLPVKMDDQGNEIRPKVPVIRFWEVGLFINEMPADLIQLKVLRADQIAMVKFFEAGFLGAGSTYPGGAIAVYLNSETDFKSPAKTSKYIEYKGYSITKEFYNPDYTNSTIKRNVIDNRTTLYWNPDVYTDANSKSVKLNFFNNDINKQFRIVVEGFDAKGRLIHIEKVISD